MKRTTLRDYKKRMLRVLVYIKKHLDEELELEELARIACFSMYHFHRILRCALLGGCVGDACATVGEDFTAEGEIGVQTIEGGEYAVTTHFGPYERLGETYKRFLGQWLPRSGRELRSAPCLEVYLNDPEGTDPEDLVTNIYALLESR
jgi:hypothetical protein